MFSLLKSLKLLSDPARVRLLLLLEREELSVAELQEIVAKGQSHVSTHLAQLKQAGLVTDRRTGKNIFTLFNRRKTCLNCSGRRPRRFLRQRTTRQRWNS